MKVALSQEEESQCTFHRGNRGRGRRRRAEEDQAAGVTVKLARAVRLAGVSRLAAAGGCHKHPKKCGLDLVQLSIIAVAVKNPG
jgi:hypothetical protein